MAEPVHVVDPMAIRAFWVSIVAAAFSLLQWITGTLSARASLRSAAAAEESARAAGLAQRPWVCYSQIDPTNLTITEQVSMKTQIRNFGQSPALQCITETNLKLFKVVPPSLPFANIDPTTGKGVLLAGLTFQAVDELKLTPSEIDAVNNGYLTLVLFGHASYQSVYKVNHETVWCLHYSPLTKGFSPGPSNNYTT
jgi:hypothetical protein